MCVIDTSDLCAYGHTRHANRPGRTERSWSRMKPEPVYKTIGAIVRGQRRKLELSQDKLAGRLGISRATLASIETGRQRMLVHQLYAFAEALGLRPGDLLPAT